MVAADSVKNTAAVIMYLKAASQQMPGGTVGKARLAGLQVNIRILDLLTVTYNANAKVLLGEEICRWETNIKMHLRVLECEHASLDTSYGLLTFLARANQSMSDVGESKEQDSIHSK
jgi:hypothetical protein